MSILDHRREDWTEQSYHAEQDSLKNANDSISRNLVVPDKRRDDLDRKDMSCHAMRCAQHPIWTEA